MKQSHSLHSGALRRQRNQPRTFAEDWHQLEGLRRVTDCYKAGISHVSPVDTVLNEFWPPQLDAVVLDSVVSICDVTAAGYNSFVPCMLCP